MKGSYYRLVMVVRLWLLTIGAFDVLHDIVDNSKQVIELFSWIEKESIFSIMVSTRNKLVSHCP